MSKKLVKIVNLAIDLQTRRPQLVNKPSNPNAIVQVQLLASPLILAGALRLFDAGYKLSYF